jgi:Na+/H+ antiporter NhaD/arsenite permease-like protein
MIWVFILILILTYTLIISQKVPHTLAALIGAIAVIIAGEYFNIFTFTEALTFIDLDIITLIIGLFILIEVIKEGGLFQYLAIKIIKKTKGKQLSLFIAFNIITFFITGIVSNITGIIIIGTLTIVACDIFDYNPIPFIMTEIFISNSGGIALVTGAIPIVISTSEFGINFVEWAIIGYPLALILLAVTMIFMIKLNKKELETVKDESYTSMEDKINSFDEWSVVPSKRTFYVTTVILIGTIIMFFISGFIGLSLGYIAITSSIILLSISGIRPKEILHNVDWGTIFFFIGLFITIGGIEQAGVLDLLSDAISSIVGGSTILAVLLIIYVAGLMSAVVDNVPITLTFIPVIYSLSATIPTLPIVNSLAIGSELGGNILPIGSPPAIVGLSLVRKSGRNIGFKEYAKFGVPLTIIYLVIATFYILLIGGLLI